MLRSLTVPGRDLEPAVSGEGLPHLASLLNHLPQLGPGGPDLQLQPTLGLLVPLRSVRGHRSEVRVISLSWAREDLISSCSLRSASSSRSGLSEVTGQGSTGCSDRVTTIHRQKNLVIFGEALKPTILQAETVFWSITNAH